MSAHRFYQTTHGNIDVTYKARARNYLDFSQIAVDIAKYFYVHIGIYAHKFKDDRKKESNLSSHFLRERGLNRPMNRATALLLIVTIGVAVWQNQAVLQVQASSVPLPSMTLTVVCLNGTQVVLNETQIGSMENYRAYGGFKNQLGNIKGLGYYTGVPLNTFCNLVGGMNNDTVLKITATDGYTKIFTYDEVVNGAFTTYDNVTGQPVQHNQPLTPILAYHFNEANISSDEGGPLRVAVVGPEGLVTPSVYWVKWLVKLELRYCYDAAVLSVILSKSIVGQGYPCDVNVTVTNQGGYDIEFGVTVYANGIAVGTENAAVTIDSVMTIVFSWNTTGFAKGAYSTSAYAWPVDGEIDTEDNMLVHGSVVVAVKGDINADTKVDGKDVAIVAKAYNTKPGDLLWNPNADINADIKVDGKDIATVAKYYGTL